MLLQFEAYRREDLNSCNVDCWVFPGVEPVLGGYTLRDALYRFLVQGIRRAQSAEFPIPRTLGNYHSVSRAFYNSVPLWRLRGGQAASGHPEMYTRYPDEQGYLLWMRPNGGWLLDENGQPISDSRPLLHPSRVEGHHSAQQAEEDLWSAN
jgi:hypothetical protein